MALSERTRELLSRGDHDGVEDLFVQELSTTSEPVAKAAVLGEMARFFRDFRRDKGKAIDCYLKAFELDTTRMDLLEEVGAVYHQKESFDDLVARLREEAKAATDPVVASRWWAEMADVELKLVDRLDDALTAANEALRLDPSNARARAIAETVLLQRARWPELADFYRRRARDTSDANEKVALLFRLAATWRDKLKDPLRTMETYEEIVSAAPNNIRIYALIDELKRDRPTWQKVAEGLVADAKRATKADEAALSWALAGKVYLKYLADDVSASDCYLALVKADPDMPAALKALRELATRRGEPRILARGLTDAAAGAKDKARRRDLFRELGALYRGALAAPSLAAEAFASALELDPADASSAEALEALYAELGEWEQLASHLRRRIESAPKERAPSLLARLGEVLAERLGSPAAAIEVYEDALKREPHHRVSLLALERLFRDARAHRDLARVYRALGETAPDRVERIRVHKALAAVSLEHLHDVNAAAAELEAALKLDPQDVPLWESLEAAYAAGEKWEELLRIYGSLPSPGEPANEAFRPLARSWYRRAAEICARRMTDPAAAALWYRRARFLDPQDASLRDALGQQYQAAAAWSDLVALLEEEAQASADPAAQASALLRAGLVAEEKMSATEAARKLYERAAASAPTDPAPLKALERIYLRSETWERLSEVYTAQSRIGRDTETRAAALRRLARVERDKLRRPARAAEAYQALAGLIPDDREAVDALRTLLADQRRWQELLGFHRRALEQSTSAPAKAQILREMAELQRGELRDPDGALESLEEALALEPDHRPTLEQAADLYALRGRWSDLIAVRTRALPHLPKAERVSVHLQIARAAREAATRSATGTRSLVAGLEKSEGLAREHLEAALALDPKSAEARDGLRTLLAAQDDAKALAALAEQELSHGPPDERRAELYMELGRLAEEKLGDPARAMASYQAASEIRADATDALAGMRRLLAARGAWAEYAKVAELEASKTKDPAKVAVLHRELARLWGDRFGQAARAAGHWRKVLELSPGDRDALLGLAEALGEADDPAQLDAVLARIAGGEADPRERAGALKQRAALAAGPLKRPEEAVELYRQAVELDPDDAETLGELARLLEKRAAWRELLPVLTARRRLLPTGAERARTLRSLGDVWRLHLQNAANAAEAYRGALEDEPDPGTVASLAEVAEDAGGFARDLARVREALDAGKSPAARRAALDAAAGKAWLDRFKDPARASDDFGAAIAADPTNATARAGLIAALEQAERWDALATALEESAEVEPRSAAQRLARAAIVARDRLDDRERAVVDLCRAIERRPEIVAAATPEDREVRDALEALYAQGRHWEPLKDLYTRGLALAPANPAERSPLRLRLGDLYRDRFADPAEATRQYAIAAEEDPRNARAHESLAELAIAVGDDVAYARHASAAAEALSPHPRAAAWLRKASDAALRAMDPAGAAAFARRALALEPRDASGLESLAAALSKKAAASDAREDWDELARTLARRLALPSAGPGNQGKRAAMAAELATIHADKRGDPDEAARVWERALSETEAEPEEITDSGEGERRVVAAGAYPEALALARAAAAFFQKTSGWSGLAAALGRLAEVAPDDERADALRRLSTVLAERLGDKAAAARALERLTELDPDDLPALEALARLYRDARDWERLLKVYERAAIAAMRGKAGDAGVARATELLRTLAEVWETRLGSAEGAAGAYRRLLELAPGDADGAEGLRRCLTALGRWKALAEADEVAIGHATTPARRAELWTEVARVRRDRLDDEAGAAQAFEAMLGDAKLPAELRPEALAELSALYVGLGRWKDAARVERDRAAVSADPKAAAERIVAAALLVADRIGDPAAAIALLETARARPVDADGKLVPAPEVLETALEGLYERAGRHEELETLLASRPATPALRARRAALLAGPLGRPADALALTREAVAADPADPLAAETLRTLARREGSRKDLKLAYDTLLAQSTDASAKALLLCDSAEEALRGTARAAALEEAARVDPTCRRAVRALRERSERRKRWAEAAEWLAKEEPLCADATDRAEILGRRAAALSKAGDGKAALEVYRSALAAAPHRIDLLGAQAALAFELESWDEAAKAYERLARAGAPGSPAEAAEIGRRQGEIALRQGHDDEAIAHLQDALASLSEAEDPPQALVTSILRPLARLYGDRGQWKAASRTLKQLLERADTLSENDRVEARLRAGEARARLGEPAGAAAEFRRVLDEKPGHLDATLGLAEALASAGEGAEALVHLERFADESKDVERRRDALRRIGELKLAAGDADGARRALAEAVRADASDRRAVEALAKLHADRGEWLEVLGALTDLAAATPAGPARGGVYRQIAETYDKGLGDQLRAREFYDKAITEAPGDAETERAMGTLLGRLGHWTDLADHLEARLAATPGGPARLELLLERGRLLRDRLERPDEAAALFGQVVDAAPERADARREKAKALAATGRRASEAVAEYLRLVGDDPSDMDAMAGLAESAAALGDDWRADAASAALGWAGARAPEGGAGGEPQTATGKAPGTFVAASGARLDPLVLRKHLVDPGEAHAFADALREIAEETPEVLAVIDADPTGPMPPLDATTSRLAQAAQNIAQVLGVLDAQFVGTDGELPVLTAGRPPRVALPRSAPTPAVLFALGRGVDALRDGRHRIVMRDAAGVQQMFAALAAAALGDGAGGPASPDLVRSFKKTFGWRTKRTLRPILEPLAARIGAFDFVGWRAAVSRTSARAGLLVCGDLGIALDAVVGADIPVERRAERLRSEAAATDLIRWALSDDYARIRAELLRSVR